MDSQQQDMVAQYCAITGADPNTAQTVLASANWNLENAVALHFAANDEAPGAEAQQSDDDEPRSQSSSQPTTAQPTASSSSSSRPQGKSSGQRPKQMTLDDLKKMGGSDDDEEDEKDKKQDMFAGGEKSGLAVQNPGQGGGPVDHFKNIMNQARQNRERPPAAGEEEEPQQQRSSNFTGRAQTLGGDDAPSEVVEDPSANTRAPAARVARTLHLWADGVSIDDGPLFRFDDPANQNIMQEINRGRAPLALLDVQPDQEVDLNLEPHQGENYVQPKPKYKPFGGSGQRLGSPTPGAGASTATAAAPSSSNTTSSAAIPSSSQQTSSSSSAISVNESQPTISLRIQLGDGTRLTSRFNTTHTIGDVYAFVDVASPQSQQRPYALMTTFPSKELEDKAVVLGDLGEFKRGGVVVQKWK